MSLNFFEFFGDDDSESLAQGPGKGKGKDKSKDGKNKGKGKSKTTRQGKDAPYFYAKGEGKGKAKATVFHVFVHDMVGDLVRVDLDPAPTVADFIGDCVEAFAMFGEEEDMFGSIDDLFLSLNGRALQDDDLLDAVVASGQTVVINQGP